VEKRRHQRTAMTNLSFEAFDGVGCFHGEIADASRVGICMPNLPRKMNSNARRIKVVINGRGKKFKMQVNPRWTKVKGCGRTLGAEIQDPPLGWAEFIMSLETKPSDRRKTCR
jgi:hypothetical protein